MWAGVTPRFRQLHSNVLLTDTQLEDGGTKVRGIVGALNERYYGGYNETANAFLAGSWGKGTNTRPPRDIDLFYVLPIEVFHRFQNAQNNRQSQLLQEVRGVLSTPYPQTNIRGDGQVVVVGFNTIAVEVVPSFQIEGGRYFICDTHNGGSYKSANPHAEIVNIEAGDVGSARNLRSVIRILKKWKHENNVPLKSYLLEALATEFMAQCQRRSNGYFYYDWIMRDFFTWLVGRANGYLWVPDEIVALGDDWKSRAENARDRAVRACVHEQQNQIANAGDEWQKIFGLWVPKHVEPVPGL
ncbi:MULTISPECIES: nucleotidyltransferase [unclassified Mesorhizobium]|uniref:SMODS domain-containing nucleotidyltransferase n=1 Tax=unclassified Mesorhizobium TaxID=325217 RepID=UPI001092348A|nr:MULTISPECIES: nucleotidyltransferase [unclassified Mesorhizobium]TGQ27739.1 nucleotidyltransferase [Mesorhizobium sp. M4B.F.Ca.ET.214.01.1.1]TGQ54931.1 nucleotidyltransferase [Mesorhizobium sp. M4B.F.Ca.ET.211.01.1.1]TGU28330.1 nucleotidyltransferase [Mesorhizobium sp. M4B.F.Ca.ET.150.01.1.1]